MIRFVRFFYRGPGAVLVIVLIAIGIAWLIARAHEKRKAEAEKHQVQRPLGQIKPGDEVDKSQAPKEVILSDRKLQPGATTGRELSSPQPVTASNQSQPVPLPTLVSFYAQVAPTPTPAPSPAPRTKDPDLWLPPSIFIPCVLVNTVESSHINTPVVGEVTTDVFQKNNGVSRLIIPAGTLVSSFAQSGAVRDRIEVSGVWLFVFPDGRQLRINGIACDREANPTNQQFGIEDGSAGLQGELIESDHWANAKAFIALLMTATMQTGTAVATSALQASHTTGVVGLPDTTPILSKYLDQLLNGETGDGRFVRVSAGKEFYVFPTEVTYPTRRSIEDREHGDNGNGIQAPLSESDKAVQEAINLERRVMDSAQATNQEKKNEGPRFTY
jgi:hypothetical protein